MTEYTKKPFRCIKCKTELGQTEGMRLYCGNAIFALKVTVTCAACGEIRVWRPILPKDEEQKVEKPEVIDNNGYTKSPDLSISIVNT